MKDIRPQFTDEEYAVLKSEADQLHISMRKLVHDRALQCQDSEPTLSAAQCLSTEMSKNREVLNQIIKQETTAEICLYEDDVIRLEMAMKELEEIVTAFIAEVLRKVH